MLNKLNILSTCLTLILAIYLSTQTFTINLNILSGWGWRFKEYTLMLALGLLIISLVVMGYNFYKQKTYPYQMPLLICNGISLVLLIKVLFGIYMMLNHLY